MPDGSATAHLYRPKLATILQEGYRFKKLRSGVYSMDGDFAPTTAICDLTDNYMVP